MYICITSYPCFGLRQTSVRNVLNTGQSNRASEGFLLGDKYISIPQILIEKEQSYRAHTDSSDISVVFLWIIWFISWVHAKFFHPLFKGRRLF